MFRERPDLNLNDDNVEDLWVELFSPFQRLYNSRHHILPFEQQY